jgi:hypothetical protein
MAEQMCENCEYFIKVSTDEYTHAFGDCMNPETTYVGDEGEVKGVFRWGDGTCVDFKPKRPGK